MRSSHTAPGAPCERCGAGLGKALHAESASEATTTVFGSRSSYHLLQSQSRTGSVCVKQEKAPRWDAHECQNPTQWVTQGGQSWWVPIAVVVDHFHGQLKVLAVLDSAVEVTRGRREQPANVQPVVDRCNAVLLRPTRSHICNSIASGPTSTRMASAHERD